RSALWPVLKSRSTAMTANPNFFTERRPPEWETLFHMEEGITSIKNFAHILQLMGLGMDDNEQDKSAICEIAWLIRKCAEQLEETRIKGMRCPSAKERKAFDRAMREEAKAPRSKANQLHLVEGSPAAS